MDHVTKATAAAASPVTIVDDQQDGGAPSIVLNLQSLPKCEDVAKISTAADDFDIAAATKAAEGVDIRMSADLKVQLSACGRALRTAARQKTKSRMTYHRALGRCYLIGTTALQSPGALVALAKKRKVPTTKASWKNPHLVLLKVIDPKMDDKSASMCARALNYCSAVGVPAEQVADFLAEHGVVALAREEAKRQQLRRGDGSEKPAAEDPVDVLRQNAAAVLLPGPLELEGLPQEDGEVALMIVGRQEGELVAWAVDADEKSVVAAARRVLKRKMDRE